LADLLLAKLEQISLRMFRMSRGALSYEPEMEASIYAEAFSAKRGVLEYLYDIVASGELIYFPLYNYTKFNLDDVRRMLTHPRSLFGLSDAGAHVGTVCDASFPTFLLSYWGRDRAGSQSGLDPRDPGARGLALPFLIERLTRRNARYLGLDDRGVIAIGKKADLNVIDHEQLGLSSPRLVHDLPAGGKRLLQGASGYRATLVSGVTIARDGRLTGERPGRVVRGAG
jgi:N-acyl-D-aspartate/D-glutamate deacylase